MRAATAPVARAVPVERLYLPLAIVGVAGVPFVAFAGLVLHHFYVRGGFLLDSGWLAFVAGEGGLRLANPLALGGGSYFNVHVAPILVLTSFVRPVLGVPDAQFFAGLVGLAHALPGLGVFWLLRSGFGMRGGTATLVAALLALAFAFNGLALAIVRYPHCEILIAGALILCLATLFRRRLIVAGLCCAVALLTREDAGFHLFGLLFVLVALNRWHGVGWRAQRPEIAFALVAACYSAAAVGLQLALSNGTATFARIYLDAEGPTTFGMILERLLGLPLYRAYLVLPAVAAGLWAWRTRNPYLVAGYAAVVPWTALQLVAHSNIAGTLSGYYAYPFLVAAFWPLLGALLDARRRGVGAPAPLLPFAAMIVASFVGLSSQYNPGHLDLPQAFVAPPSAVLQAATDEAIREFVASKPAFGSVLVDGSIAGLAPNAFRWSETVQGRGPGRPDTVLYFAGGYESDKARGLATAAGLARRYRLAGTAIRLATDRAPPASLAPLLAPAD